MEQGDSTLGSDEIHVGRFQRRNWILRDMLGMYDDCAEELLRCQDICETPGIVIMILTQIKGCPDDC